MTTQTDITADLANTALQYATDDFGEVQEDVTTPPEPAPEPETPPTDAAPGPEPEPATPTAEPLTATERQRLQGLEKQQQDADVQKAVQQIDQEAERIRAERVNQGYGDDIAGEFARIHKESRQRELQTILQSRQATAEARAKEQYQQDIGKEFGVNPADLADYDTIQSMRAGARVLQRLSRVEKAQTTTRTRTNPQNFESGATSMGGGQSPQSLLAAMGNLEMDPSQLTEAQIQDILKFSG